MTSCPCGCGRSVKPDNTYAARGCAMRAAGRRRQGLPANHQHTRRADEATTCRTCGAGLTAKERNQGVRRCMGCRLADPGRPHVRRYADGERVTEAPTSLTRSFWLGKSRDEFSAAVRNHQFRPVKIGSAPSPPLEGMGD